MGRFTKGWKMVVTGIVVVLAVAVAAAVLMRVKAARDTSPTVAYNGRVSGKVAIVYYSQSKVQNTALIARWIQKNVGGDLIPIETVEPYPEPYFRTLAAAEIERRSGKMRSIKPLPPMECFSARRYGTAPARFRCGSFSQRMISPARPLCRSVRMAAAALRVTRATSKRRARRLRCFPASPRVDRTRLSGGYALA